MENSQNLQSGKAPQGVTSASSLKFAFPDRLKTALSVCMLIGAAAFAAGLFMEKDRAWGAFLTASLFVLFLSLGGVFFTAIQHVSKAGWSVNIRRLMEGFGAYLPWGALAALALLFSGKSLYIWFDPAQAAGDHLLAHKAPYLNIWFFSLRLIVFFGIWIWLARRLAGFSLKQDQTGDPGLSQKSARHSVAFLILFTLSFTFFTVDVLMSLEPHWFSTVFGLYAFSGLIQSFIAALILLAIYFRRRGPLAGLVNENHLHDLGKFLLGFTIFWAYIAFSQYMLIWYANLPEETGYYHRRAQMPWLWLSLALIVFKFIVPFLFLLPRWVKRDERALIFISSLILIMQYADIYWMTGPSLHAEGPRFGFVEAGALLGFGAALLHSLLSFLSRHPAAPLRDPYKPESDSHAVTY